MVFFNVFIGCTVSVDGSSVVTEVGKRHRFWGSPSTSGSWNCTWHSGEGGSYRNQHGVVGDDISGLQLFGPPHIHECKLASMSLSSFVEERTERQFLFGKAVFLFGFVLVPWCCFNEMEWTRLPSSLVLTCFPVP